MASLVLHLTLFLPNISSVDRPWWCRMNDHGVSYSEEIILTATWVFCFSILFLFYFILFCNKFLVLCSCTIFASTPFFFYLISERIRNNLRSSPTAVPTQRKVSK
ncbi:hypothetical protein BDV28DRAFT_143009 [Aspergillus coremiiformis]|uniref:Uncharacterized protein n=1 Tax=Aspergillus coremiiformis TaxID=138285 RepID=A0A5N6YT43_9EURO|nr:hypothetical protein BDV28DRAFT_143009 [Aspergillus coremiiformis]